MYQLVISELYPDVARCGTSEILLRNSAVPRAAGVGPIPYRRSVAEPPFRRSGEVGGSMRRQHLGETANVGLIVHGGIINTAVRPSPESRGASLPPSWVAGQPSSRPARHFVGVLGPAGHHSRVSQAAAA